MSKHKGIRFCDKCMKAIPKGDAYYEYDEYRKDKCSGCKKKYSLLKMCVGAVLLALVSVGSWVTYDRLEERVDFNEQKIDLTAKYVANLENRIKNTFASVGQWASTVETRIAKFYEQNEKEAAMLQRSLDEIAKQTQAVHAAHAKLLEDLTTGKMTNKKVAAALASLQVRQRAAEEQLQIIMRNPTEIINKVIKPTVGIAVKTTKVERLGGSGVLYKKIKIVDPITKNVTYRYYGFTCYHVWASVLKYYEDIKKPDPSPIVLPDGRIIMPRKIDKTLNPTLLLYYYGGDSRAPKYKIAAKFVGRTHYMAKFRPQQDIAVFTFESNKDLAVAELASDKEIKDVVYYGSRVYTTGIALGGTPSLYFGTTGNPDMPGDTGILFQAFGYFGQSGGPIYDARTLKVISINQRVRVHPVGFGSFAPLSNTIFGTLISKLRENWKSVVKTQHKKLLD